MACRLGSVLGGASPDHVLALEAFGLQIGTAFQLLDDIQDYLSNQTHTGKEPGRDLAEGKVTLPVLVAFRQAGTRDKKRIRQIISAPQREKYLKELTTLLDDHGGFSYTLRDAEERVRKGVSALHTVSDSEERAHIERAAWKMFR
jgi:octaprenyl-diphosphate synthase